MWWQARAAAILLGGALRAALQYRLDVLFTVAAGAAYQASGFIAIWIILDRFDAVAGWTLSDMALLYGMRLAAHGLWVLPLNQLILLADLVREGTFDRMLTRPVHPLLQLLTTNIRLNTVGDLLGGVTILVVAMAIVDVDWTVGAIAFMAVSIIAGALIEGGFQLGLGATAFRTVRSDESRTAIGTVFSTFGNYPVTIFGPLGQWLLTTVLPTAFVAYLPAAVLVDKVDGTGLPRPLAYLSPIVGLAVAGTGHLVWNRMLRHYQSTGS